VPAREPAVEDERLGPQGGHVALHRVCAHAATVPRMDPARRKPLNAVNDTQYGVSAAEMPTASYRSRMSVPKFSRTMPG
jgi:hypothetical protein